MEEGRAGWLHASLDLGQILLRLLLLLYVAIAAEIPAGSRPAQEEQARPAFRLPDTGSAAKDGL